MSGVGKEVRSEIGGDVKIDASDCLDDFANICRTCCSTEDINPIFESYYEEVSVSKMLKLCASIEISKKDMLPKNICSACLGDLVMAYTFREKSKQTEANLKERLKNFMQGMQDEEEMNENKEIKTLFVSSNSNDIKIEEQTDDVDYVTMDVDGPVYKCAECDNLFLDKDDLEAHSCMRNDESEMHEEYEDAGQEGTERLDQNEVNSMDEQTQDSQTSEIFICQICETECHSLNDLREHLKVHTQEQKVYKCWICSKAFNKFQSLKEHMTTHTESVQNLFRCNKCSRVFESEEELQEHILNDDHAVYKEKRSMPKAIYHCEHCGRDFKLYYFYENHVRKYHPEHIDNIKNEDQSNQVTENTYQCDVCDKTFPTKLRLQCHKVRHGERSFACAQCGKTFYTKTACLQHARIHSGEKPFRCEVCGKGFRFSSSYETHSMIHKGTRPYFCKQCPKTFIQLGHLNTHIRSMHSGEKMFACPYCPKRFALKGNLTVHIRIHTGETPYVCPVCNRGFYDSSSMKKHAKSKHDMIVQNNVEIVQCDQEETLG